MAYDKKESRILYDSNIYMPMGMIPIPNEGRDISLAELLEWTIESVTRGQSDLNDNDEEFLQESYQYCLSSKEELV